MVCIMNFIATIYNRVTQRSLIWGCVVIYISNIRFCHGNYSYNKLLFIGKLVWFSYIYCVMKRYLFFNAAALIFDWGVYNAIFNFTPLQKIVIAFGASFDIFTRLWKCFFVLLCIFVSQNLLQSWRLRFESWCNWIFFNLPNPFSHTMAQGLTQPLTEMKTRNLSWGNKAWLAHKANNFITTHEPVV
jgi:hypothetical protein